MVLFEEVISPPIPNLTQERRIDCIRTLYSIHLLPHQSLPLFKLWQDDPINGFGLAIGIAIPFIQIQIVYQHRPAGRAQFDQYFGYPVGDLNLTEAKLPRRESINDIVSSTFTRIRNKTLPGRIEIPALGTTNSNGNVALRGDGVEAPISMDNLERGLIAQEERTPLPNLPPISYARRGRPRTGIQNQTQYSRGSLTKDLEFEIEDDTDDELVPRKRVERGAVRGRGTGGVRMDRGGEGGSVDRDNNIEVPEDGQEKSMGLVGIVVDTGKGRDGAERDLGQPETDPEDEEEEELVAANDGPPDPPKVKPRRLMVRETKFAEENKGRIIQGVRRRNVKGGSGG